MMTIDDPLRNRPLRVVPRYIIQPFVASAPRAGAADWRTAERMPSAPISRSASIVRSVAGLAPLRSATCTRTPAAIGTNPLTRWPVRTTASPIRATTASKRICCSRPR